MTVLIMKCATFAMSTRCGRLRRSPTGSGHRLLVNNAARDDQHNWQDVTAEYWDERQATNIRHMFFAIQAVAPGMIEAGGGSIINMRLEQLVGGTQGGFPAYTAKSAVRKLTRTMARDLGQHRIRVNTVVPGWIMTDRQKELWVTPEAMERHLTRQCLPDRSTRSMWRVPSCSLPLTRPGPAQPAISWWMPDRSDPDRSGRGRSDPGRSRWRVFDLVLARWTLVRSAAAVRDMVEIL